MATDPDDSSHKIEVQINRDFAQFTKEDEARLLTAVRSLLGTGEVSLTRTEPVLVSKLLIIPADKTREGTLVGSVTATWFEFISKMVNDRSAMYSISPETWEEIIAGAYYRAGFDEVTLTPRSGDLGRDVIAIKKGIGTVKVIDQVKAYKPGHLVPANDVRALAGILDPEGASKGFVTTTSDFAPRIPDDPFIQDWIRRGRLELVNGELLLARLEWLAAGSTLPTPHPPSPQHPDQRST